MDKVKLARDFREIVYHAHKQLFNQISGVSAIAGLLVGSWVASTFTNSPIKGFLSSWGLMRGGTHVVSTTTYRFLSVLLGVIATARLVSPGSSQPSRKNTMAAPYYFLATATFQTNNVSAYLSEYFLYGN